MADLQRLADDHEIRSVIYRYCRGIDRRDFPSVRACYHSDATDDHGEFSGGVEAFMEYIQGQLPMFLQTMHFIGNLLVEFESDDVAHTEAYTLAFHRLRPTKTKPERDFTVALRYIDRFEKRDGTWAVAKRRCVFSFQRMDFVANPVNWSDGYTWATSIPDDVVYQR